MKSCCLKTNIPFLLILTFQLIFQTAVAQKPDTLYLSNKVIIRDNFVTINDYTTLSKVKVKTEAGLPIINKSSFPAAFAARTNNNCSVKASFTHSRDTAFSKPFNQTFTNTSTNATSISWVINGFAYYGGADVLNYSLDVGMHEIKLVATNGSCSDTAVAYYFCSGKPSSNTNTYIGHYGLPMIEDYPTSFDAFKDGGFLLGGYSYKRGIENDKGIIMKVRENGCIEWTKSIEKRYGKVLVVKATKDGGFVVAGYTSSYQYYFMRFDKDGQVLWQKSFNSGDYMSSINQIYETEDGSFMLTAANSVFNGFIVMKVTATGDVLWNKLLFYKEHDFATPTGIVQKGNHIYISGYIFLANQEAQYNSEHNFDGFILKLNINDGSTVWTKNYGAKGKSDFFQDIHLFGDNLLVNDIRTEYLGGANATQAFHILNEEGEVIKSTIFVYKGHQLNAPFGSQVIPISGDRLYLFNYGCEPIEFQPGYSNLSNFLEVDTARNIYWQKTFLDYVRGKFLFAKKGQNDAMAALGGELGMLQTPYAFSNDFLFTRIERMGLSGNDGCNFGPANFSLAADTILSQNLIWSTDVLTQQTSSNVNNEVNTFYAQVKYNCPDYIDSCSFLKLTGPMSICNLSDTLTYKVHKNSTCFQSVDWEYPTEANVIEKNDSVLKFKVSSFGNFKVAAMLANYCTPIKDSLVLYAAPSLLKLNLGKDTSLCPGNTLKLSAGPAFSHYLWQDGSVDSTFIVSKAGNYWVEVEDSCGNMRSDSISVTITENIPINAGPDKVICQGTSVSITATPGFSSYSWSPAYQISSIDKQTVMVSPENDTVYYLKAEKSPGCIAFDTINIKVNHAQPLNFASDTSFCEGGAVILDAGKNFQKYLWNDGSVASKLVANHAGEFSLQAWDNNGCLSVDTLKVLAVFKLPFVQLSKDSLLCLGTVRTLDAGYNFKNYLWSTGSTAQQINAADVGQYSVTVKDSNGCIGKDSMHITQILPLPVLFLPADTVLCSYSNLLLKPIRNFYAYTWNTGSVANNININKPGIYWLDAKDRYGCIGRDSITIAPKQCMEGVYIPTAFSPNGDGKNDIFRAMVFGNVIQFRLSVYNRWGEKIFETSEWQKGWDGRMKAQQNDTNIFIWVCQYQLYGKEPKVEKGSILLIK